MSKLRLLTIVFALIMGVHVWSQTTVHNAPSGQIVLTSEEYVNNLTRQYNIYSGTNSQVVLDIVYNTEPDYDYIYIYECDGSFNKLALLETLDGQNSINLQTSTPNGRVVVLFISDGGTCGADGISTAGYTINWNTVESSGIATNNSLSPSDQVLIGSVSSAANLRIQEYQNKSLGDIKEPIQDYSNSMILLETESGSKLGLSYNKIGANGNFGMVADGYMALLATDYSFGTSANSNAFKISSNGNIGIGTTIPRAKLDVAGAIWASEIKVEAQTADFVFEEDYNLRDLDEVERFIKENKHLPDIPSASQMDETGVNLAEMNKLLLQKIEELTLYIIKQKEEQKLDKAAILSLENRIEKLESGNNAKR